MTACTTISQGPAETATQTAQPALLPLPGTTAGPQAVQAASEVSVLLKGDALDPSGNKIGAPAGVIVDPASSLAQYLVVETTGLNQNKRVLIPWGAFNLVLAPTPASSGSRKMEIPAIQLNVTPQDLAGAPEFSETTFNDHSALAAGWDQVSRQYWSGKAGVLPVTGGTQTTSAAPVYFHSHGTGQVAYPLISQEGKKLGQIWDLIIRPDGSLAFALVQPVNAGNRVDALLPTAWKALTWNNQQATFTLTVPLDLLDKVPPYNPSHPPDMSVPGWDQDWESFWKANMPGVQPVGQGKTSQPDAQAGQPVMLSALTGSPLTGQNGSPLGDIAGWLFDTNGAANYVVLQDVQRFLPLPWQSLGWQPVQALKLSSNAALLFHPDPVVLKNAPAFDNMERLTSDTAWHEDATKYWSSYVKQAAPAPDAATPVAEQRLVSAAQLFQGQVLDHEQKELGPLSDLILAVDGTIQYGLLTLGGQLRPVPWANFEYNFENNTLVYLDDPERLAQAPGYNAANDIHLSSPDWDQEVRTYWGMK